MAFLHHMVGRDRCMVTAVMRRCDPDFRGDRLIVAILVRRRGDVRDRWLIGWTAKAPAIGSIASDAATKKASMVRPMRMRLLESAGLLIHPVGRSSDDFASRF